MKCYLITTGIVFALLVVMHVWRAAVEGMQLFANPIYALLTVLSLGLSVWAFVLLGRMRRPR